jgi:hypothetical protein
MADPRAHSHFFLERTRDGLFRLHLHPSLRGRLFWEPISFIGPGTPILPDRPLSRAEFYALLSKLSAQGYWDSLLR